MQDNPGNRDGDSVGFTGLIAHARLMGWLCLFSFVGFVAWILK